MPHLVGFYESRGLKVVEIRGEKFFQVRTMGQMFWYNGGRTQEQEGKTMKHRQKDRIGEGIRFERIRRITGYLVGSLDRWGNAKRAEERDRVHHTVK